MDLFSCLVVDDVSHAFTVTNDVVDDLSLCDWLFAFSFIAGGEQAGSVPEGAGTDRQVARGQDDVGHRQTAQPDQSAETLL